MSYKYDEIETRIIFEIEEDIMKLKRKVERVTRGGMPLSAPAFHKLWDGLVDADRALDYHKETFNIK